MTIPGLTIWIDADAAPRAVKEIIFRAAKRLQIDTILVANQSIAIPANHPTVSRITVREGANEADRYIVDHSQAGDLVITADVPLAAELVKKKVHCVDPRGEEYHADNVASKLSMRDFMDEMRGAGTVTGGSAPYNEQDKKAFASTFDRLVTRLQRSAERG